LVAAERSSSSRGPPKTEEEEMRNEAVRPISGTFTSAEGQEVGFEVLGREPDEDEYRWIVLEDGQAKGAKKGARTTTSGGSNFIDSESNL
jgi:hypothetical protein